MKYCWFCGEELIWNCDYSYEDYDLEGDGIIAVLTCPNCGATWEDYLESHSEEEE